MRNFSRAVHLGDERADLAITRDGREPRDRGDRVNRNEGCASLENAPDGDDRLERFRQPQCYAIAGPDAEANQRVGDAVGARIEFGVSANNIVHRQRWLRAMTRSSRGEERLQRQRAKAPARSRCAARFRRGARFALDETRGAMKSHARRRGPGPRWYVCGRARSQLRGARALRCRVARTELPRRRETPRVARPALRKERVRAHAIARVLERHSRNWPVPLAQARA